MDSDQDSSLQLEFLDIEIINHKKEQDAPKKWKCNQCSLFYLSEDKLAEHKKKHSSVPEEVINCRYCGKALSSNDSKECVANKKCETCEYRCQNCPQRFLRYSSLVNHEQNHSCGKKKRSIGIRKSVDDAPPAPPTVKRIKTLLPRKRKSESDPVKETKIVSDDSPKKKLKASNGIGKVSNNEKVLQNSSKSPKKKLPVNPTTDKVTAKQTTSANTNASSSVTDNSVNYKPFSCHVCGDNFASDNILLQHIKTHGDAANSFKCKYCGNEFENIYDMQYHLAICPLAEDEIDAAMKVSEAEVSKVTPKKSVEPVEKVANKRRSRKSLVDQNKDLNNSTVKEAKSEKSEPDETFSKPASPAKRKSMLRKPKEKSPAPPIVVDCAEVTLPEDEDNDFSLEYSEDPLGGEESLDANDTGGNTDQTQKEDDNKKLHICPFPRCSFKFTREKALLCHMRNHGDDFDDTLKCHRCDIPFDDLKSLRLHIDECKGIKEEEDDDFQRKSVNKQKRSPEKPNASTFQGSSKGWLCKVCDRVYPSKEKLARHNCPGANPLSSKFPCRVCQEELKNLQSLKAHFTTQHPRCKIFKCPTCSEEFDDLKEVLEHGYDHAIGNYECHICMEKLESKRAVARHFKEVHPGIDRCVCTVCNKRYSNSAALAKHRHVHTGERPFHCPFCFMTFSLKSSQQVHVRRHINFRPFCCKFCPKKFFNSGDMTKHERTHTSERPYGCDLCGQRFVMRENLTSHWRRHQSNKMFLKCPKCPKAFNSKSQLYNHLPIHSGVKPFQCPLCEESSFHIGGIQTHIKRVHIKEGMTQCEICFKTEELTFKLVQHIMTHRSDFFQTKDDWIEHLSKVKPNMALVNKGKKRGKKGSQVKTTEQDIYGIVRKRRGINKVNGPVIPLIPGDDFDEYLEKREMYNEEETDTSVLHANDNSFPQVKQKRRRRTKAQMALARAEAEANSSGINNKPQTECDDPVPLVKPKRKRRTKAQMALARAQENADKQQLNETYSDTEHEHHFMADPLAIEEDLHHMNNVNGKQRRRSRNPVEAKSGRKSVSRNVRARRDARDFVKQESDEEQDPLADDSFEIKTEIKEEVESEDDGIQEVESFEPHLQRSSLACTICNETFENAALLGAHVFVHI